MNTHVTLQIESEEWRPGPAPTPPVAPNSPKQIVAVKIVNITGG